MAADLNAFFFNSPASVIQLELLEISHPNFSQTYRIVRNAVAGVTVTHEDASVRAYTYYPARIKANGDKADLDSSIQVDLGDLGDTFPNEMDLIAAANGFGIKPIVKYRTYRSDDLTQPLTGPLTLEVKQFSHNGDGLSFEAAAPRVNVNKTGEVYSLDRFPMLRGFV